MTNTNHNVWTLTVHIGKSINKAAAKVDKKIYGDTVIQDPPKPPPSKPWGTDEIVFITAVALALVALMVILGLKVRKSYRYNPK